MPAQSITLQQLNQWREQCNSQWHTIEDESIINHICPALHAHGYHDELHHLLLDNPNWLHRRTVDEDTEAFRRDVDIALMAFNDPLSDKDLEIFLQLQTAKLIGNIELPTLRDLNDLETLIYLGEINTVKTQLLERVDRTHSEAKDRDRDIPYIFNRTMEKHQMFIKHAPSDTAFLTKAFEIHNELDSSSPKTLLEAKFQLAHAYLKLGDYAVVEQYYAEIVNIIEKQLPITDITMQDAHLLTEYRTPHDAKYEEYNRRNTIHARIKNRFSALRDVAKIAFLLEKDNECDQHFTDALNIIEYENIIVSRMTLQVEDQGEFVQKSHLFDENDWMKIKQLLRMTERSHLLSAQHEEIKDDNPFGELITNFLFEDDGDFDRKRNVALYREIEDALQMNALDYAIETVKQFQISLKFELATQIILELVEQLQQHDRHDDAIQIAETMWANYGEATYTEVLADVGCVQALVGNQERADDAFHRAYTDTLTIYQRPSWRQKCLRRLANRLARADKHDFSTQILYESRVTDVNVWLHVTLFTQLTKFYANNSEFDKAQFFAEMAHQRYQRLGGETILILIEELIKANKLDQVEDTILNIIPYWHRITAHLMAMKAYHQQGQAVEVNRHQTSAEALIEQFDEKYQPELQAQLLETRLELNLHNAIPDLLAFANEQSYFNDELLDWLCEYEQYDEVLTYLEKQEPSKQYRIISKTIHKLIDAGLKGDALKWLTIIEPQMERKMKYISGYYMEELMNILNAYDQFGMRDKIHGWIHTALQSEESFISFDGLVNVSLVFDFPIEQLKTSLEAQEKKLESRAYSKLIIKLHEKNQEKHIPYWLSKYAELFDNERNYFDIKQFAKTCVYINKHDDVLPIIDKVLATIQSIRDGEDESQQSKISSLQRYIGEAYLVLGYLDPPPDTSDDVKQGYIVNSNRYNRLRMSLKQGNIVETFNGFDKQIFRESRRLWWNTHISDAGLNEFNRDRIKDIQYHSYTSFLDDWFYALNEWDEIFENRPIEVKHNIDQNIIRMLAWVRPDWALIAQDFKLDHVQ